MAIVWQEQYVYYGHIGDYYCKCIVFNEMWCGGFTFEIQDVTNGVLLYRSKKNWAYANSAKKEAQGYMFVNNTKGILYTEWIDV